jgi:hypothetical protein
MFVFGCPVTEPELYELHAEHGIRRAAEPDSVILAQAAPRSPAHVYNVLLDQAARLEGLEALILIHEEAEILDPDFCATVRSVLSDPAVAVIGCAGGVGLRGMAWWDGAPTYVASRYRSREFGRAELPGLLPDGWNPPPRRPDAPTEVQAVDGVLMVISAWAVRNVRFDESLGPRYGFDYDFCMQVRAAGRRVVVANLQLGHYYPLGVIKDPDAWMEAHVRAAEKWDPEPGDWKAHARQAEGEAAAARLLSASKMYECQALAWAQEREFTEATDNLSWRLTAPLRKLMALSREARAQRS